MSSALMVLAGFDVECFSLTPILDACLLHQCCLCCDEGQECECVPDPAGSMKITRADCAIQVNSLSLKTWNTITLEELFQS